MSRYFQYYLSVLITGLCLLSGCKSNSPESNHLELSTVKGKLTAPDGATPISGATVYIGKGQYKKKSKVHSKSVMPMNCTEPGGEYEAFTCTDADGSFELDLETGSGTVTLNIVKGVFNFTTSVNLHGEVTEAGAIAMPADNIKMAVVTGPYDRMQDILAKVGYGEIISDKTKPSYGELKLGTETFDLYDGDGSLPGTYPEFEELFQDKDGDGKIDLMNYNILFINCGVYEYSVLYKDGDNSGHGKHPNNHMPVALDETRKTELRDFVKDGGTLYVTDLAYDFVEQVFPQYVDFYGSDNTPPEDAEIMDDAEVGESDIITNATVLNTNLKQWLGNVDCGGEGCLNEDGTVHIEGFLYGWAVINGPHEENDVSLWAEGAVSWYDNDNSEYAAGTKPLTVSFSAQDGKVIFSSYHTVEEDPTPEWKPQERILQYLVFE